jgi:hypothetical protein
VTRDIQKENERRVLCRVLAALGATPESEPQAGEAPDFILQLRDLPLNSTIADRRPLPGVREIARNTFSAGLFGLVSPRLIATSPYYRSLPGDRLG